MRRNKGRKLSRLVDRICIKAAGPESAAIFHITKNWHNIIGLNLAKFCQPVKLTKNGNSTNLIIGVYHPSLSINIQSKENHILENIAKLIGYRMIGKIRLKHVVNMQLNAAPPATAYASKHLLDQPTFSNISNTISGTPSHELADILQDLYDSFFDSA